MKVSGGPIKVSKASGNPARTKKAVIRLRKEQRLVDVERLWADGKTIDESAVILKVAPRTIRDDRQILFERFKQSQLLTQTERRLKRAWELECVIIPGHLRIYQIAMADYEKTRDNPKETTTLQRSADGASAGSTIKEESRVGDPRFLAIADKAMESVRKAQTELRRMFGDDVQPSDNHESNTTVQIGIQNNTTVKIGVIEDERWYGNDAHADNHPPKTTVSSIAGIAQSSPIQGDSVRPAVGQNGNGTVHGH